jgi:uncharacterized iron-regulated protein
VSHLLVGEEQPTPTRTRVERRVLEELVRAGPPRHGGLEMYPYTEQKALDGLDGGIPLGGRVRRGVALVQNWGYNWGYYRDVFLFARDAKLRMRAVNAPREVVSAVRKKGYQGSRRRRPRTSRRASRSHDAEHMRMFKASFEDESFHAGMDDAAWQAMLDAQCAWDATMGLPGGEGPSGAGDDDPKSIVVVLVGAGHVSYGLGIERQLRAQGFTSGVASIIPVPVADSKGEPNATVRRRMRTSSGDAPGGGPESTRTWGSRPAPARTTVSSRSLDVERARPPRAPACRPATRSSLSTAPRSATASRSHGRWPRSAGATMPR